MPDRPQQSYLGKVALIAWREFRHTALTKGFIIGAVAVPILMFGVFAVVPSLMSRESPPLVGSIAIVDPTGSIAPRAKAILEKPVSMLEVVEEFAENPPKTAAEQMEAVSTLPSAGQQKIEVAWRTETDPAALDGIKSDLETGKLIAGASIGADTLDPSKPAAPFEFFIPSSLSPKHVTQISRAIRKAIEEERVARSGVDSALIARLSDAPEPKTMRVSPEGAVAKEITELRFMVPVAFMFLLWITVFTSANYLLTTTIEEKSNKVMEVLLAAASPMQLLVGKILGYAAISAVMLVMYGGLGIAGLSAAAMLDLVPFTHLLYLVLFFVMGYLMVAAMMSAVGSAVSDLREAQSLVGPVMMVLIVPVALWLPIVENPNGMLATVTSYIPPATPFVMIMRLTAATEPIPLWQTITATLWGFVCAIGMMWLAARIFRVGVLMQGKPPSPKELLRWAFVR
ncbi:MAG: ABC transporter permease [Planctomycetota bacterium]|nr:ABC transporter permease [Planctomycetota bacterium]